MIFVTVGTHEQQFNRLVRCVDELKGQGHIVDEVIIQTGYSDYVPQFCMHSKFFSHSDMIQNVKEARIVITHGGPSSFIMPLQIGKIPVVVPRSRKFGEHVNNHQMEFVKRAAELQKNLIPVYDIEKLPYILENYKTIADRLSHEMESHNKTFNRKLEKIVAEKLGLK